MTSNGELLNGFNDGHSYMELPLDKLELMVDQNTEHITVSKQDIEKLIKEISWLRRNTTSYIQKVPSPKQNQKTPTITSDENELDHWKSRYAAALAEVERQKKEKFGLQEELLASNDQIRQQLEYCSAMGAACCTLLWRVSRCEESIQPILVGTQVDEFLNLLSSTLESYMATYTDEVPHDNAEETQFVLALCGIITNIAAASFGREFLVNNLHGQNLIPTFLGILRNTPEKQCSKLKNLILMSLYNLSINEKALRLITSEEGTVRLLVWIVQKENTIEVRVHALRLIQSLLFDHGNLQLKNEASEFVTTKFLQQLSRDNSKPIREITSELTAHMKLVNSEQ